MRFALDPYRVTFDEQRTFPFETHVKTGKDFERRLQLRLRGQIHRRDNPIVRKAGLIIEPLDVLALVRLEQTHASAVLRSEGAAKIPNGCSSSSQLLSLCNRGFLRAAEVVHADSAEVPLNHESGHESL